MALYPYNQSPDPKLNRQVYRTRGVTPYMAPSEQQKTSYSFWDKGGPGNQQQPNPYADFTNTAMQRSNQLFQGNKAPNLNYMPQNYAAFAAEAGGDYPHLDQNAYGNAPTARDAQPWMENLSGGIRSQIADLVKRTAGAGVQRGGMGVAGGVPLDSSGQLNAMKSLGSQYGDIFDQGMGYAQNTANWGRDRELARLGADQRAADAQRQLLTQFYNQLGNQAGQQLSMYGTNLGAANSLLGQQLSGTQAGADYGLRRTGMQQADWNADVNRQNEWDRWLLENGGGGGNGDYLMPGERPSAGSRSPSRQPIDPSFARIAANNANPNKGTVQDSQQQYNQMFETNPYRQQFRSFAQRMSPNYAQGFNFTPEDMYQAALMGIKLPDQGKVNYAMQSQTGGGAHSSLSNRG